VRDGRLEWEIEEYEEGGERWVRLVHRATVNGRRRVAWVALPGDPGSYDVNNPAVAQVLAVVKESMLWGLGVACEERMGPGSLVRVGEGEYRWEGVASDAPAGVVSSAPVARGEDEDNG
jgi:hypothetical protein